MLPVHRRQQATGCRPFGRDDEIDEGRADEVRRAAPEQRFHGAVGVDDAVAGIELQQNLGPGEREREKTVALGAKG